MVLITLLWRQIGVQFLTEFVDEFRADPRNPLVVLVAPGRKSIPKGLANVLVPPDFLNVRRVVRKVEYGAVGFDLSNALRDLLISMLLRFGFRTTSHREVRINDST